jgi:glycosyltransferase involved in cell wall biosynthesis
MGPRPLSATVLICTYNRASLLRRTLESLAAAHSLRTWDVLVVDNNSTDDTSHVVADMSRTFPVCLTYAFEGRQGKSYALNSGIERARGDIILFTDDDVRVAPQWMDEACAPFEADPAVDYTGGPVRPLWETPPPAWLDQARGDLWGTLAILDYGDAPFVFEDRCRVPLGANMAVRRTLIERIGGFHPEFGRRGRSLLGQEQAEFFARGRSSGARGVYVPAMEVHHHVPAGRLTKQYFRRWWYWKGVSRARVDLLHRRTELGLDLRLVPHVARVPRFVWGLLPRSAIGWVMAAASRDRRTAARHEMHCAYVLGYIRASWARSSRRAAPHLNQQPPARAAASVSR